MKTILIIDDHSIVRTGIKLICKKKFPSAVTKEADNEKSAIQMINAHSFDLIIMDLNMPQSDPTAIIYYIKHKLPNAAIVILTTNEETVFAKRFFKMGIKGYLNKSLSDTEIETALNQVVNGKIYISEYLKNSLAESSLTGHTDNPFESLTDREFQVMQELLRGKSITDISDILNIHVSTVSTHKTRLFEKLNISTNSIIDLLTIAKTYKMM